jgi:predicted negative regulator of RcsB-dependent stress response
MYDAFMIAALPTIWILLNITSFIAICIYELSHAIPALIFSKGSVTIYIGVYGDNTAPRFKLGRLIIYVRPKFNYLKNRGMCIYKTDISFTRQFIILVFAPVVVLAIACLLFHYVFFSALNTYVQVGLGIALVSIIINLIVNLFPKKIPVKFTSRLIYSDGYEIILLGENSSNYQIITAAAKFYDDGNFANAQVHLRKVDDKYMDESIFRMTLACYVELKNYSMAKKFNEKYAGRKWYTLIGAYDYNNLALAEIGLKNYNEALINLDKSIKRDPDNFDNRRNRGYVNFLLENFDEAKKDLNKAIFIDETCANAFSYRALVDLKLGRPGEALIDIEKAIALDENNTYAILAMGIYYYERGNHKAAMQEWKKAKLYSLASWIDENATPGMEPAKSKPKPRGRKPKRDSST